MKKNIFIGLVLIGTLFLMAGCYEPSPLYGTWQTTEGEKIIFVSDGTYTTQKFKNPVTKDEMASQGTWNVIDNVLVISDSVSGGFITQWDIRGSILYLNWTTKDRVTDQIESCSYVIYRVSK